MSYRIAAGALVAALSLTPSLVHATGGPDPDFGTGGVVEVALLDEVGPVTVDSSGRTVLVGTYNGKIAFARYRTDGTPDPSFSGDGRAEVDLTVGRFGAVDIRVLADGSIVSGGERTSDPGDVFSNGLWAAKVTTNGSPAPGYGTNGVASEPQGFVVYGGRGSIAADGSMVIVQVASGSGNTYSPVSAGGTFKAGGGLEIDTAVLPPGCIATAAAGQRIPSGAATTSSSEFVHAVRTGIGGCSIDSALILTRQNVDGSVVWSRFIPAPEGNPDDVENVLEVIGDHVFMATSAGATQYVRRFAGSTGAPVATWGTGGRATIDAGFGPIGSFAELPGGLVAIVNSPLATGSPSVIRIERLLSNGQTDPSFGRVVARIGGALTGSAIAGAPDGGVVVAASTARRATLRRFLAGDTPAAVPVSPARVLETRPGLKTIDGKLQATGQLAGRTTTKIRIAGRGGVPTGATAAIVNLTIVGPTAPGYATLYPCTPTVPTASNINYLPGDVVANSVTAKLDTNGDVCLYTLATTDALIDVNGYTPPASSLQTVSPARVLETRPGLKTIDGKLQATGQLAGRTTTKIRIAGRGGVPTGATAAIVNLTIVGPTAPGYATLYPCTPTVPTASNINYLPGDVVANSVTAKLDTNGDVCLYTLATTDALIDVNGYTPPASSLQTVSPARVLETRPGLKTIDGKLQATGQLAGRTTTKIRIAGRGGVPTGATAAIVNLTIVGPTAPGYATLYPCTPTVPTASNINYLPGDVVANSVTAKLDTNGDVCLYTLATTDALIDVNGYIS